VLVILVAGAVAYSNSFAGLFVFDDEPSIRDNRHVARLWPLTGAMSAPPDTTLAGRPVASLTFAIDYALAGRHDLARYHTTNLAIHLASALLLFGVARRTLLSPRMRATFGDAATLLAAALALIWVVHPVQTGTVTYIVQRVESLMGLFFLATLYCAIRALEGGRQARRWTIGAIAACGVGMGAKEVMATAPLVVWTWDRTFGERRDVPRRALYGGLCATWIVLLVLVAGKPRAFSVGFGFAEWPWWRYLATQAGVVVHYLRLAFAPSPLVLDYGWPPAASAAAVLLPGAVVVALLGLSVWALARRLPLGLAGAWWFLILAPTSSVIPIVTEVAAEHRLYLPLAAPIAVVVAGAYALARRAGISNRAMAPGGLLATAALVALLATMTQARNLDYQDYDRIWSDTIAKRPLNARARNNYATSLIAQARFAEAEEHLRVATRVQPDFVEAEGNLGVALCAQGRFDEGIARLTHAVAMKPDYAAAHRNLAEAYGSHGRMAEAVAHYSAALRQTPDELELLNRTAWILATTRNDRLRDGARARELAERAVRLTNRRDAVSLDSLGAALAEIGDFTAAQVIVQEAIAAARAGGDARMLPELENRLRMFGRGEKFRDTH
jgi:tetratricopeptide (TPR) repeat protein